MSPRLVLFASLLLAGAARAAPPAPAPAAKGVRAVITPVITAGRDAAEAKVLGAVEAALVEAARRVPGLELTNLDGNKPRGPARVDAKADPRPQARGQVIAKEANAELAIVAEPQPLGDGAVTYLQVVEVGGKVRGSTTVAISADALQKGGAELERPLRGGLVQILDPAHFVGRVELRFDVKGAEVDVDGKKHFAAPAGAPTIIELSVGTHAVRVTHPAYRDYLRFVEISYDKTQVEAVAMSAFPLTEGEMAEKRRGQVGVQRRVPWYRSWWALTITGAVLFGATVGIVYGVRPGFSADEKTRYDGSRPAF